MMMVGSAGLAADRSLFWTILGSYAKKGQALPELDSEPLPQILSKLEAASASPQKPNS